MARKKSAKFMFDIDKVSGNVVLQVEEVAIGYEETLSEPIDLDIRREDAIALVGPNGIGKSTLLKSLIGQIPFIKGTPHFGTNVTIGYYDQGQADLHGNKTILAELWDEHRRHQKRYSQCLRRLSFSGEDVEKRSRRLAVEKRLVSH